MSPSRGGAAAVSLQAYLAHLRRLGIRRLPRAAAGAAPEALERLRRTALDCRACKLRAGCRCVVFGEGPAGAPIMFIGEGPGEEEDRQGRPFVGPAGQLLARMLEKLGLARAEVYIANVVKCRPPGNRDPEPDEIAGCRPLLEAQVAAVGPRVIVALGRVATQALSGSPAPISRLRGQFVDFRGVPLMPTFHPSYLLRNPRERIATWNDMLQVLERLGRRPPARDQDTGS